MSSWTPWLHLTEMRDDDVFLSNVQVNYLSATHGIGHTVTNMCIELHTRWPEKEDEKQTATDTDTT